MKKIYYFIAIAILFLILNSCKSPNRSEEYNCQPQQDSSGNVLLCETPGGGVTRIRQGSNGGYGSSSNKSERLFCAPEIVSKSGRKTMIFVCD